MTIERTRRSEPDSAYIVMDHVALFAGAAVAVAGVFVGASCLGRPSGTCDASIPLIIGGLGTETLGFVALAVDSGKRRTTRDPHDEIHGFGISTRECARIPAGGVDVSLVPDAGPPMSARTDDDGVAKIQLPEGQGTLDVDVRVDGHGVRRQRLR